MLFDTHMHTLFSTDSKMKIEEAVNKGRDLNIGITITEHMDLGYPESDAFQFDIEEYLSTYNDFRNNNVLLGIEIGMRHDCLQDNRSLVQNAEFDFVIGSIHVIDNIDIYHESFYRSHTKREVYGRYFGAMLECLKCYDFIDSLGHIDYIARYARYKDPEIYYPEFADLIDPVLNAAVEKEKPLEINTRRISDNRSIEILMPIYKRFAELGGKFVTIGSDAHKPHDIGRGLTEGMDIAAACGLTAIYFKRRQAHYIIK